MAVLSIPLIPQTPAKSANAIPLQRSRTVGDGEAETSFVTVDWSKKIRAVDAKSYGVDCPACFDPAWTHNPGFLQALATVTADGKPLIRLHGWGMVQQGSNECWLNKDNTWNAKKIESALAPLVKAGYKLLIDIPAGPGGDHNLHDLRDTKAMASFAAALVKIVNVDNHFDVRYWELPNEQEHTITATEMAALLSDASTAMKAVDPKILFGGPALDHIDVDYMTAVVKGSLSHLDFVSAHTYGGDGKQTDAVSYASALKAVADVHSLRARLTEISKGKYLPIFIDEYNIGYEPTPKIFDNAGAVYFSLIQAGVVDAGGDVSAVWDCSAPHDMSIVEPDGTLHVSANLFSLMNRYFYGSQVSAMSPDSGSLYVYAVENTSSHSILLSNLTEAARNVAIKFTGWTPKASTKYQISSGGFTGLGQTMWPPSQIIEITLPSKSVTVLISNGRSKDGV